MYKGISVFLTGSEGFIGSKVKENLKYEGLNIFLSNNRLFKKEIEEFKEVDFKKIDCICHLGASSKRSNGSSDIIKKNIIYLENLLYQASKNKNIKFIFISANSVVGNNSESKIDFKTVPTPNELYSVSKLIGEQLLFKYFSRENISIIRLPAVYGKFSNKEGLLDRLAKKFIQNAKVKLSNHNLLFNNAAMIDDIVEFISKSILDLKNMAGKDFILGSSSPISLIDMANKIKSICNSKSSIEFDQNCNNSMHYILDISLAQEHGFKSVPMNEIINNVCKYYEK